jgi:hypothetical protein
MDIPTKNPCGTVKSVLLALLGMLILGAAPTRADVAQELWHTETTGKAERSLSYSTHVNLRESRTPATITFYCNTEHTQNSIGTLGFRVEIAHYTALTGFHFSDFEGPGAPAVAKPLMTITIKRSSGLPLLFEISPAGFVSSDERSDHPFFSFVVASPTSEPSAAKEILKALAENAQSLQISIMDMRDPLIKLELAVPVTEKRDEFSRLVGLLDQQR